MPFHLPTYSSQSPKTERMEKTKCGRRCWCSQRDRTLRVPSSLRFSIWPGLCRLEGPHETDLLVSQGHIPLLPAVITKKGLGPPCLKQISFCPPGLGCQIPEQYPECHISFDQKFEVRFKVLWSRINTQ